MKWLSTITGLFGSSDSIGKVMETAASGIYNGIDKLKFTEEEKSDVQESKRSLFVKFAEIAYDQNSIRAVTRRWLAFLVVGPTVLFFTASGIAFPIEIILRDSIIIDGVTTFYTPIANHWFGMFKELVPWAGGALVFYFGPHLIGAKK